MAKFLRINPSDNVAVAISDAEYPIYAAGFFFGIIFGDSGR